MKFTDPSHLVIDAGEGQFIPVDPDNADYRAIIEGNTPVDPYVAPDVTANDIKTEAQRRIIQRLAADDFLDCVVKQLNAIMRAVELTAIRAEGGTWTPQEATEAAALRALTVDIKRIRAKATNLKTKLPADYADEKNWS